MPSLSSVKCAITFWGGWTELVYNLYGRRHTNLTIYQSSWYLNFNKIFYLNIFRNYVLDISNPYRRMNTGPTTTAWGWARACCQSRCISYLHFLQLLTILAPFNKHHLTVPSIICPVFLFFFFIFNCLVPSP